MNVEEEYETNRQAVIARTQARRNAMQSKSKRRRKCADTVRRRWRLFNAFVDGGTADLKSADVLVWMALFRHAKPDGAVSLSRGRMVAITGLAPNTVTRALARLVVAGWLSRIRRGGPSGGLALYRVKRTDEVGQ